MPHSNANVAPVVENILVRSVNWLGDAVMSTAALQRLREAKPGARITLLSPEKLAVMWERQPFLDDLLTFSASDSLWQTARRLRERKFTTAVAFPNSIRSALELWLAAIPRRLGYARPGRSLFLSDLIAARPGAMPMRKRSAREVRRLISAGGNSSPIPPSAHHIHDYLHLVSFLGASPDPVPPLLVIGAEETAHVVRRFGLPAPSPDRPCFGLNPGAEYGPAKRWPVARFIATAIALQKQTNCHWLIFGGAADLALAASIAGEIQRANSGRSSVLNFAGKTTLRELAAALKHCRLLLTNDTGPLHLAAALGTPAIVPFGSTSPEMTGPWPSARAQILRVEGVPCSPCFLRECPIDFRCMTRIEPAAAVQAAMRVLSYTPDS